MAAHPSPQNIKVAVDAVIFAVRNGELVTLLIQMKKKPFTGRWAFPGGLLDDRETAERAARRILDDQTGVRNAYLEQLATFDDPKRDPFGRVVSVAYVALVASERLRLRTTAKYADVRWWPVDQIPPLAYDHRAIARRALERVRARLEYTNVVWSMLPSSFTLRELQGVYEIILGRALDKRNFLKKILSSGLLVRTGKERRGGAYRPAALYRFRKRTLAYVEVL